MGLFGQMIIIRANQCPYGDGIDYWAISPLFGPVEEGMAIPWYEMEFQTIDHGPDFEAKGHANQCEHVARAIKRKEPGEVW